MQRNEFLCVNNIIYQIYNVGDFNNMRLTVLNLLKTLIPNSCASILMADYNDPETPLRDPVCLPAGLAGVEQNYLSIEQEDFSRWTALCKQSMVIRSSELMDAKKRIQTALYKKCFEPYGLHYSLELILVREERFLGVVTLYRTKEEGDFTNEELFLFQGLSDHLNMRFYKEYLSTLPAKVTMNSALNTVTYQYGLTEREAQVLGMVFNEFSTADIADKLCISSHTLKKHMQNLYRKTGVSSRFQLLKFRS